MNWGSRLQAMVDKAQGFKNITFELHETAVDAIREEFSTDTRSIYTILGYPVTVIVEDENPIWLVKLTADGGYHDYIFSVTDPIREIQFRIGDSRIYRRILCAKGMGDCSDVAIIRLLSLCKQLIEERNLLQHI